MADLRDLARRMETLAREVDDRASAVAIHTAMAVFVDLENSTPVDTTRALSNWQVKVGSKPDGRIDPYVPGVHGSTRDASIAVAITNALRIMSQKRPGESIWISNNLPYIKRLNDGYSAQAPAGFVERAVLIGRKSIGQVKF